MGGPSNNREHSSPPLENELEFMFLSAIMKLTVKTLGNILTFFSKMFRLNSEDIFLCDHPAVTLDNGYIYRLPTSYAIVFLLLFLRISYLSAKLIFSLTSVYIIILQ